MNEDRSTSEDPTTLAAEYALGLLEGDDLKRARELDSGDPNFHAEVARWRGRLAPLADDVAAVDPPTRVWPAIVGALGSASTNVVQLEKRVRTWRAATAGMTALAASLAVVLLIGPVPPRPTPGPAAVKQTPMVAILGADKSGLKVVASWNPAVRQLVVAVPGEGPTTPGHSHELWIIPPGGKPQSLGTMPSARRMHMQLAEALAKLLQEGATIAISVEPPGGSPTGQPTGPVVATGALESA